MNLHLLLLGYSYAIIRQKYKQPLFLPPGNKVKRQAFYR